MATFGPPLRDSASQYDDIYNNPEGRFGVQNPRSNSGSQDRTLTSRPSEDGRRGRTAPRRYRGPQESNEDEDASSRRQQAIDNRYYSDSKAQTSGAATPHSKVTHKRKVHTSAFARARGVTFGIVTISWLVPVYVFWQLPIAIVGAVMLGLSTQVEASYLLSAIDSAAQMMGGLFGYEYVDLTALGMLAIVSAAGFGVISSCIAGFTAILWGLHPLSGNAASAKTATFIVGVVGACIPFANMFPWIIFWVLVMMRHPK